MAFLIGLSLIIGYEIGRKLNIQRFMLWALLFAYATYIGLQNAVIFFVHDITLQIPFLMLLFLVIVYKKTNLYYPLFIFNLGFKESFSVTGFALGISLLFLGKFWKKHAIATIIISLLYGLVASKLIVPYYQYLAFGRWGNFTYNPEPIKNIFTYLTHFVDTPQKRETIITSLATFGLLPLVSFFALPLVLQDFAQRFVLVNSNSPLRQGLNLHYNANLAVILFVGSLFAISYLQKKKR